MVNTLPDVKHPVVDSGATQAILTEIKHLSSSMSELRQTVSSYPALIERQAATERRQIDSESRFTEALGSVNIAITRIHERLDEARSLREDARVDAENLIKAWREDQNKQSNSLLEGLNTQICDIATGIKDIRIHVDTKIDTLNTQVSSVRNDTSAWINKGKGAWWAASILWGLIQVIVIVIMSTLFADVRELRDWKSSTEQRIKQYESDVKHYRPFVQSSAASNEK